MSLLETQITNNSKNIYNKLIKGRKSINIPSLNTNKNQVNTKKKSWLENTDHVYIGLNMK